ncbi:MAG: hypothetical protein ACPG61_13970 [Paracoccaceae bacterium]
MTSPTLPRAKPETITIASGESLSAAINLNGRVIVGIIMPAAWTTAAITMQACDSLGGTYVDVYATGGAELSITTAASRYVAVDPVNQYGINFAKIRSGTTGTPVNQGAERSIVLMIADQSL